MKLSEIIRLVEGKLESAFETDIIDVGKIETAKKNEITFISNPLYSKFFVSTNAGAVLVSKDFEIPEVRTDLGIIRVHDPYIAFVKILEHFNKEVTQKSGISEKCTIEKNVIIGENVFIDDFVVIGENCRIGKDSRISANCSIGNNVKIGNNCQIFPNVVMYKECIIGNNVIIHSGSVIGSDGFGFAKNDDGSFKKILQKGNVVIEDNVEIGSNCNIDRATLGETKICRGVKMDNQIQIGHNVYIGEDTVIVAQVGIAGSTKIGKRCMIGGQSGIVGHLTICDDVIIGAAVGVSKSITKPGIYTGYRGKPMKDDLKQEALIRSLESLRDKIIKLEKNK